jgi:hypothetical protein
MLVHHFLAYPLLLPLGGSKNTPKNKKRLDTRVGWNIDTWYSFIHSFNVLLLCDGIVLSFKKAALGTKGMVLFVSVVLLGEGEGRRRSMCNWELGLIEFSQSGKSVFFSLLFLRFCLLVHQWRSWSNWQATETNKLLIFVSRDGTMNLKLSMQATTPICQS